MSKVPATLGLCDKYVSLRHLPVNFRDEDRDIFFHELYRKIGTAYLLKLENLTINGYGVVFQSHKSRLHKDILAFNDIQPIKEFTFILKMLSWKVQGRYKKVNEPVVLITDRWSHGYFHWLTEVLPRLLVAKEKASQVQIILPSFYERLSFVKESLSMIGYNSILFMKKEHIYHLKKVLLPTHFSESGIYNDKVIKLLRTSLVTTVKFVSANQSKYVYISRRKTDKRRISNGSQLVTLLLKYDFEIVITEDLSFTQQASLFSRTDILLTNHGAGLTNMLFMKEGSKVIELRYKNDFHNNCYFALASALDVAYYYSNCEPVIPEEDPHTADLIVDLINIESILKSILGKICAE